MQRIYAGWNPMGTIILGILSLALLPGRPAMAAQDHWPMRFERPKATIIMYTPQVEDMKDDKITAYAAVSVLKKESKQPFFGAVSGVTEAVVRVAVEASADPQVVGVAAAAVDGRFAWTPEGSIT